MRRTSEETREKGVKVTVKNVQKEANGADAFERKQETEEVKMDSAVKSETGASDAGCP